MSTPVIPVAPSRREIAAARSERGGWSKETLAGWGVDWPPQKGWKQALAGGALRSDHPLGRPCPTCNADPGQRCVGKRGHERRAFHRSRGSRSQQQPIYEIEEGCESPIEEVLVGAILGWIDHHELDEHAELLTQVPVGPYRADMVVEAEGRRLAVECDGAKFHNSPDAVARDKRRDRYFVTQGIFVMRFTGAEIRRDPRGCAAEVGTWIRAQR